MPRCPNRWKSRFFGWGAQLCSGTEPEQALDALDASVRLVRDALREKDHAAVRLYPSLGLAAAVFLPFCFFSLYISAALWQTVGG